MFKKFILVLVFLGLVFSAFAQISDNPPRPTQGILTLTGENWVNFSTSNKEAFIRGVFFGLNTMLEYVWALQESPKFRELLVNNYKSDTKAAYDLLEMFSEWAYFSINVQTVIVSLDKVYEKPENRKYGIVEVLLVEYDKNWWTLD